MALDRILPRWASFTPTICLLLACLSQASPLELALTTELELDTEDGSVAASAGPQSMPPPPIHEVAVGRAGEFVFDPPFIEAAIGDLVRFTFMDGNHTVTESTYMSPCVARGAFDSNFFHSASGSGRNNDMTMMVDTDNPRWFFCRQRLNFSHCSRGMVFAINPGRFWEPFCNRIGNSTEAIPASSGLVGSHALPTHWTYEPRTSAAMSASSEEWRGTSTSGGAMTLTVATTTAGIEPTDQWMTRTITTTYMV